MARVKQTARKPQTGGSHNKPVFKAFYTKSNGAPMKAPVVFLKNRPLAKNKKPTANDVTAGDIGGSSSSSSHSLSDTAAKKAMKLHAYIQRFELDDLTVTDLRTLCRSFTMNAKGTKKDLIRRILCLANKAIPVTNTAAKEPAAKAVKKTAAKGPAKTACDYCSTRHRACGVVRDKRCDNFDKAEQVDRCLVPGARGKLVKTCIACRKQKQKCLAHPCGGNVPDCRALNENNEPLFPQRT